MKAYTCTLRSNLVISSKIAYTYILHPNNTTSGLYTLKKLLHMDSWRHALWYTPGYLSDAIFYYSSSNSASAMQASLILENTRYIPISGPFHLLFSLSALLFLKISPGLLLHFLSVLT